MVHFSVFRLISVHSTVQHRHKLSVAELEVDHGRLGG